MKLRAVNLGGWFVLERWMKQSLFTQTKEGCNDETCFSELTPDKEKVLEEHYRTWITKDDILWLKEQGVNLVRIPIPWWLYGEVGYHRSVEALTEALVMIDDIGIDFMLDLHTAPGCQNGFDNGGIQNVLEWPNDQKNIDKTVEVLVEVSTRYKDNKNFHSIQLLNEPHVSVDLNLLQDFYIESYTKIREVLKDTYIVMHDGFRLDVWEEFFAKNDFHNVIFDTHMYQCFDHTQHEFTIVQHETAAHSRKDRLEKVSAYVPVIVGEWSLGMRPNKHIGKDALKMMKKYLTIW